MDGINELGIFFVFSLCSQHGLQLASVAAWMKKLPWKLEL
jgi:hypothetical protein